MLLYTKSLSAAYAQLRLLVRIPPQHGLSVCLPDISVHRGWTLRRII